MGEIHDYASSLKSIKDLAKELGANYFNASSIDLFPEGKTFDNEINEVKEIVFDKKSFSDNKEEKTSRNIIVIGAGCTFNAFKNIPLAREAITKIHEKIVVAEVEGQDLNFEYFKKYYRKHCRDQYINLNKESHDKKQVFQDFLEKQVNLKYGLLNQIGKKYFSEYEKLALINSDYADKDKVDFENSLNLLASILPISTVRDAIKQTYDYKFGPTLFYQVLAHLLKHRFIDVIINFNFDEFLDLAIEDEIGNGGYDKILSDGDCTKLSNLSIDGRLRQPLYIKPHGTASHKSTLRFTKDQYHEIPMDMRVFLEDIFSSEGDDIEKRVNLITAGFDMNSIEFNQIITKKLPPESNIFSFFYHGEKGEKNPNKVVEYKQQVLSNLFENRRNKPNFHFIGHEFFKEEKGVGEEIKDFVQSNNTSLGNTFNILFSFTRHLFKEKYRPMEISRHLLITKIFGNRKFWNSVFVPEDLNEIPFTSNRSESYYPKNYFQSSDYFKDRTLIEILINLAIHHGKFDPVVLIRGRTGYYYFMYDKVLKEDNKKHKKLIPFIKLLSFFNLNNQNLISPLQADLIKMIPPDEWISNEKYDLIFKDTFEKAKNSEGIFSDKMRCYFKSLTNSDIEEIKTYFRNIRNSKKLKIQSEFRNAMHHIFENHKVSNLINTGLLCDLHFTIGMRDRYVNTVCLISDYGHQLSNFLDNLLSKDISVYIILHDYFNKKIEFDKKKKIALRRLINNSSELSKSFSLKRKLIKNVKIRFLPIEEHNHHATIFLKFNKDYEFIDQQQQVPRAIYYYKNGLSNTVNPIRLVEKKNIGYILKKFKQYSDSARDYCDPNKESNEYWVTDDKYD